MYEYALVLGLIKKVLPLKGPLPKINAGASWLLYLRNRSLPLGTPAPS